MELTTGAPADDDRIRRSMPRWWIRGRAAWRRWARIAAFRPRTVERLCLRAFGFTPKLLRRQRFVQPVAIHAGAFAEVDRRARRALS
jgi:hypothetical protein